MKAIVIDIVNGKAALLGEDGTVRKVADRGYRIGEKVLLEQSAAAFRGKRPVHFSRRLIAAACAAALLMGLGMCAYAVPYGTVTQGDDASIEYTINVFDRVIDVRANDENGEAVLSETSNLKNMKIEDALDLTLAAGTTVCVETRSEEHGQQLQEELDRSIRRTMEEKGPPERDSDAGRPEAEAGNPAAAPEKEQRDAAPGANGEQPAPDGSGGSTGEPPANPSEASEEGNLSGNPAEKPEDGENSANPAGTPKDGNDPASSAEASAEENALNGGEDDRPEDRQEDTFGPVSENPPAADSDLSQGNAAENGETGTPEFANATETAPEYPQDSAGQTSQSSDMSHPGTGDPGQPAAPQNAGNPSGAAAPGQQGGPAPGGNAP